MDVYSEDKHCNKGLLLFKEKESQQLFLDPGKDQHSAPKLTLLPRRIPLLSARQREHSSVLIDLNQHIIK